MKKFTKFAALVTFASVFAPAVVFAQATCGDQAGFDACLAAAQTSCSTSFPACQPSAPLTIDELRASLNEKCPCATAKNYGKYRSCVAQLLNSLRKFNLIDETIVAQIKSDEAACKTEIHNSHQNQGNHGKPQ